LRQGVWYEIRSRINNREPLFRRHKALTLFARVFRETGLRFVFEVRDLRLEDDLLTFYIRPENGLELPDIMKWMKQVFAQRYNAMTGRMGNSPSANCLAPEGRRHGWRCNHCCPPVADRWDRYWSRILEGEPEVEGVEESAAKDSPHRRGAATGVRPCWMGRAGNSCFFLVFLFPPTPSTRLTGSNLPWISYQRFSPSQTGINQRKDPP
jgi:hypothetical protein